MLFFKTYYLKLARQILKTRLKIDEEIIYFNKKTTRWLGVWPDSYLNFLFYINKKMKKSKTAEFRIKQLRKTCGISPKVIQRISIIDV